MHTPWHIPGQRSLKLAFRTKSQPDSPWEIRLGDFRMQYCKYQGGVVHDLFGTVKENRIKIPHHWRT